jgi:predicted O-methyltransferase YrrM
MPQARGRMKHIHESPKFGENWFDFPDVYRRMVKNCRPEGILVEVGCWKGRSTSFLLVEAYNRSPDIEVYAVDTWSGSPEQQKDPHVLAGTLFEEFMGNVRPVSENLIALRIPSPKAANFFADRSLDGVFIDAAHEEESVRADIVAWLPKVRPGGILAGHDHDCHWPGVERAVKATLPKVEIMGKCWVWEVR